MPVLDSKFLLLLLFVLTAATYCDLKDHRIPNALSISGLISGLILYTYAYGVQGLLIALAGIGTGLGLLLPFYALGGMGAGDVKLMAAVGAFLGPAPAAFAVGLSLIAGGVLAVIVLVLRRGLLQTLARYGSILKNLMHVTHPGYSYIPPRTGEVAASPFPYALAIALGTVATVWGTEIRQTIF